MSNPPRLPNEFDLDNIIYSDTSWHHRLLDPTDNSRLHATAANSDRFVCFAGNDARFGGCAEEGGNDASVGGGSEKEGKDG